ncbi:unnamed protein product [Vicia faba]|uniref:Uncharacterized protein n=1 Tax=Vicia faba TaxID=3906 RepID=A0AAV0ZF47_VICFA|nr:unnamed protein product [Vicia faba]
MVDAERKRQLIDVMITDVSLEDIGNGENNRNHARMEEDVTDANKKGGTSRSISQLSWSRQIVSNYGIHDLGFKVYRFTWTNGGQNLENTKCHLNMGLATSEFATKIPLPKLSTSLGLGLIILSFVLTYRTLWCAIKIIRSNYLDLKRFRLRKYM